MADNSQAKDWRPIDKPNPILSLLIGAMIGVLLSLIVPPHYSRTRNDGAIIPVTTFATATLVNRWLLWKTVTWGWCKVWRDGASLACWLTIFHFGLFWYDHPSDELKNGWLDAVITSIILGCLLGLSTAVDEGLDWKRRRSQVKTITVIVFLTAVALQIFPVGCPLIELAGMPQHVTWSISLTRYWYGLVFIALPASLLAYLIGGAVFLILDRGGRDEVTADRLG